MDSLTLILFIIGFVLLISGAEFLVRGASSLAITIGISPLVVGLTVVAFGTSAPELAVTILSTYSGTADLAVGNIVGSNISNILLVLGIASLFGGLIVAKQLIRLEIPLMIAISFLVWFLGVDGKISNSDGIILFAGAVSYTYYAIRKSRKDVKAVKNEAETAGFAVEAAHNQGLLHIVIQLGLVVIGLVMLVLGSRWLINGATAIAMMLGVSELVIGLTIVAVGTSLPEIATSVVATLRHKRDIAVGNAVGSNIFNILLVLGLGSAVSPIGIDVSQSAIRFDIPVMILVALLCLPVFYTNYRISRWEGAIFVLYYATYTIYLFLSATGHPATSTFSTIIVTAILPFTLIPILISFIRFQLKSKNQPAVVQSKAVPPSQEST